jgi:hypothetical protein
MSDSIIGFGVPITTCINAGAPGVVLDLSNTVLRSGTNGIRVTNDTAIVRCRAVNLDEAITNHLVIDPGVTNALVQFDGEMSSQRITADGAWWTANNHVLVFRDENPETDSSLVVKGELQVGSPEEGREAAIGQGEAYTRGMVVLTTDNTAGAGSDGGNFIDVSTEAASPSGSTFGFQGNGADYTILVCSTLQNGAGLIQHFGHRLVQTVARVGGAVVLEVWDGAAWVSVEMSNSLRLQPYTPLGCALATFTQLQTQVRFGIVNANYLGVPGTVYTNTTWATKTINGTNGYWVRYRITSAFGTPPTFEQLALTPSRTEINASGFEESYGEARRMVQLPVHQRLTDDLSGASPGNVAIDIGTGLTITPIDNNFTAAGTDGFGIIIELPFWLDVSFPALLRLGWRPSSTDSGNVRWETEFRIFTEGDIIDSAQALDGTITESQAAPGVTDQLMFYETTISLTSAVPGVSYLGLGIQRLGGDAADTFTGNVEVVFFQMFGLAWLV